jgi:cytochrome c-type biogenesis protein CcmH
MSAGFLFSATLMLLTAVAFAAAPLVTRAKPATKGRIHGLLFVVAAAPLSAVALYAELGRPDIAANAAALPGSSRTMTAAATRAEDRKAASVTELLAGLERRLQENPDDAKGWLLLAKSYDHLGRRRDAAMAYEKAAALGLADNVLEARLR